MAEHIEWAKHYLEESRKLIDATTDPGQRAIAFGLIALTHAVLEAGFDIDNVRSEIDGLRNRL